MKWKQLTKLCTTLLLTQTTKAKLKLLQYISLLAVLWLSNAKPKSGHEEYFLLDRKYYVDWWRESITKRKADFHFQIKQNQENLHKRRMVGSINLASVKERKFNHLWLKYSSQLRQMQVGDFDGISCSLHYLSTIMCLLPLLFFVGTSKTISTKINIESGKSTMEF